MLKLNYVNFTQMHNSCCKGLFTQPYVPVHICLNQDQVAEKLQYPLGPSQVFGRPQLWQCTQAFSWEVYLIAPNCESSRSAIWEYINKISFLQKGNKKGTLDYRKIENDMCWSDLQ